MVQAVLHQRVGIRRGVLPHHHVGRSTRTPQGPSVGVGGEASLDVVDDTVATQRTAVRGQDTITQHIPALIARQWQTHTLHLVTQRGAADEVDGVVVDFGVVEHTLSVVGEEVAVLYCL